MVPILSFDYCECGCKSYTAAFLGHDYSIYWNLGASYRVTRPDNIQVYQTTMQDARDCAEDDLRDRLRKQGIQVEEVVAPAGTKIKIVVQVPRHLPPGPDCPPDPSARCTTGA